MLRKKGQEIQEFLGLEKRWDSLESVEKRFCWVHWILNLASGEFLQTDRMTAIDHPGSSCLALQLKTQTKAVCAARHLL